MTKTNYDSLHDSPMSFGYYGVWWPIDTVLAVSQTQFNPQQSVVLFALHFKLCAFLADNSSYVEAQYV